MIVFWTVLIILWLGSVLAWFIARSISRSTQVNRFKARLTGDAGRKVGKSPSRAALIEAPNVGTGKLALNLLQRLKLTERLRALLEQSGLRWNMARFIHGCLALYLLGFAIGWFLLPGSYHHLAHLVGLLVGLSPLVFVVRKRAARLSAFEEQFPDSLEFVSRSMRAGHAFSVSLEMLYHEFQEPLAGEFRRTFDEHNLGLPLDVALQKLSERVPSMDVHFFVSAVLLQKRTGGNLAELLDKLAQLIRERFKLRGRIRAISAHGRMTGMALTSIPIGVAVLMFYVNPEYVQFFVTDETGQAMMAAAVSLQVIGYAVIKKIVAIEV